MLAWAVVVAVHAALFWLASKVLMLAGSPARDDDALVLMWLPPPSPAPPPRAQPAPPSSPPRAQPAAAVPRSPSRPPAVAAAEPAVDHAADTALTAVEIGRAEPPPQAMPAAARAPWDAPPPSAKPFARSAPALPGQGAQRFRMRPPRSIASTVEQVGRMFGGGGPSDCAETRKNIRDLAVLGAEVVAQEVEEERRNCRN